MATQNCQVCERHRSLQNLPAGPIWSDENIFVAHFPALPSEPAHFGHIILEMKRHITSPAQLTREEAFSVGEWTQKIVNALEQKLNATHVYVLRIGDLTRHLHFHFVPRYANTPEEQWGPLLFRWKDGPKATTDDMKTITTELCAFLKANP